jgi:LysW-gamma-L-lysine carboxypeptidase
MDDIALLEELVSIPSPSGEEDRLAECLLARMSGLGFRARRDRVGNVIGVVGDAHAERRIVLVGHMDTVPGSVPVRKEDGALYGRGAVDAKGPLAAFVLAASRIAPRLRGARVVVVGTVDEERHGSGARYLARTMPPPSCSIIGEPSGWDGVTLGYKGMLSVDYWLTQPAGHAAGPYPLPAELAVDFWNRLRLHAEAYNEHVVGRFEALDASLRTFRTFGDGLEDGAYMNVSLRLPRGLEVASLKRSMETWCSNGRLVFHHSDPPVEADQNTMVVRALVSAIRAEEGKPRFKLKTGTSDMNIVGPAWGCPVVAYGAGDSKLDHTPDEHLEIQEFRQSVQVLSRALEKLASHRSV